MRKLLVLLPIVFSMLNAIAGPVDSAAARGVAEAWLRSKGVMPSGGRAVRMEGVEGVYLFAYAKGFVAVAADDAAWPVLGYGVGEGAAGEVPPQMAAWLKERGSEIAAAAAEGAAGGEEVQQAWQKLKAGRLKAPKSGNTVGPLIETRWNQAPLYNMYCPMKGDSLTVTGCVATAMAQIMRYWKEPTRGTGSISYSTARHGLSVSANLNVDYDWGNMPIRITAASTAAEKEAVATLMLHCGAAVSMDYGAITSSAYSEDVPAAMRNYFGYNADLISRTSHTSTSWTELLKSQLDALHPIYYSGSGEGGGHAFVCDGYDGDDFFHFNWGWNGSYDGYFRIGALNPGGGGTGSNSNHQYNNNNKIIIIEPNSSHLMATTGRKELSRYGERVVGYVRSAKTTSSSWTATSNSSWLTLSPAQGQGNGTATEIAITADYNYSGSERRGTITFTQGDESVTLTFTQADGTPSAAGCYGWQEIGDEENTTIYLLKGNEELIMRPEAFGTFTEGKQIDSVAFYIYDLVNGYYNIQTRNFHLIIYEGSEMSEGLKTEAVETDYADCLGTEVYSQAFRADEDGPQVIRLSTPYAIHDRRPFWVAIRPYDSALFVCEQVNMQTPISEASFPLCDSLTKNYLRLAQSQQYGTYLALLASYDEDEESEKVYQFEYQPLMNICISDIVYSIATEANNSAYGTVEGGGRYTYGTDIQLSATAAHGYRFAGWSDGNSDNPRTVTVAGDATYRAIFEQLPTHCITATTSIDDYGIAIGSGCSYEGDTITLQAIANDGYTFSHWNDGNRDNPRIFVLSNAMQAEAEYEAFFVAMDDPASEALPEGALPGLFSISGEKQVHFSQGNLQWLAKSNTDINGTTYPDNTWRFANLQYDFVGGICTYGCPYTGISSVQMASGTWCSNNSISPSLAYWIDLFGWGTSGWSGSGATSYYPYNNSTTSSTYFSGDLTGDNAQADWGVYNSIVNGGNAPGLWRIMTADEWEYLLNGRTNASQKKSMGQVLSLNNDYIHGIILLPDEFTMPSGLSAFRTNITTYGYSANTYTNEEWSQMEAAGAVFLPMTGFRQGTEYYPQGNAFLGSYWTSTTINETHSKTISFSVMSTTGASGSISISTSTSQYAAGQHINGNAVRLIYDPSDPPQTNNCHGIRIPAEACDSYTWDEGATSSHGNGQTYTESGTYYGTLYSEGECSGLSDTLDLTIRHSTTYTDNRTVCDSIEWNGSKYYQTTNSPTYTTTGANGCDSTATLHLTVNHSTQSDTTVETTGTFTWHGQEYNTSGHFYDTISNDSGCDSIITLHLTITEATYDTVREGMLMQRCDTIYYRGIAYTTDTTIYDTTAHGGMYDTIYLITFSISHSSTSIDQQSACDSYEWHGTTYTESTSTPTYRTTNSEGCDSIVTLHLTIGHGSTTTDNITACDSYTWIDGTTYTSSNTTATYSEPGSDCPTLHTLNLTMNYSSTNTDIVVDCDSYTWIDNITYTSSTNTATYIDNSGTCPNTTTLNLTINQTKHTYNAPIVICEGTTAINNGTGILFEENFDGANPLDGWDLYTETDYYYMPGFTVSSSGAYSGKSLSIRSVQNNDYIWQTSLAITPNIYINDPVNCTLTFKVKIPATNYFSDYYTDYYWPDGFELYFLSATQDPEDIDDFDSQVIMSNNQGEPVPHQPARCYTASSFTDVFIPLAGKITTPGYYRFCFRDFDCYNSAYVDNIVLSGPSSTPVPAGLTVGDNDITETFTAANGCDSIVHTIWRVIPNNATAEDHEVCASEYPVTFYDKTFSEAGIQVTTISNGTCSNTITINVTTKPDATLDVHGDITPTICLNTALNDISISSSNASISVNGLPNGVTWNGSHISGTPTSHGTSQFTIVATSSNGCGSTSQTGIIMVIDNAGHLYSHTADNSYSWATDGTLGHGDGQTHTSSGTYYGIPYVENGCDKTDTLELTINTINCSGQSFTASACDNFTWSASGTYGNGDGTTYYTSGTYYGAPYSSGGCDNLTDTLFLTIDYSNTGDTSVTSETPFTWHGNTISETGTLTHTYRTVKGCDSVVTLHYTLSTPTPANNDGTLNGLFSISDDKQVRFSRGNLQYLAKANGTYSDNTWRFALNQYDFVGGYDYSTWQTHGNVYKADGETLCDNNEVAPDYDGWIDLFCWGTSGWNSGANLYQPTDWSRNGADFYPGANATNDLTGSYAEADWGVHNAIVNGGNAPHLWRVLTLTEWTYLLNQRSGASSKRALATVNGVKGLVLLPDTWTLPAGCSFSPQSNGQTVAWTANNYTAEKWTLMETNGAVFLPAAGYRGGDMATDGGHWYYGSYFNGRYWTSTHSTANTKAAYQSYFFGQSANGIGTIYIGNSTADGNRDQGSSVRLVRDNTPCVAEHSTADVTACDSYTWVDNVTYTESNNSATYTTTNAAGCVSIITLNLTIKHSSNSIDQQTACDRYTWHDTTYSESNTSATYDTINAAGCDSTVTLHLTINHNSNSIDQQTACDSYTWHGTAYTESNTSATFDTLNAAGCDSTVTLHLTIGHATTGIDQQTACDSYSWHGTTYTADNNTAIFDTLNAAGCDSTVTLSLTIGHASTAIDQQTACDSYSWHGTTYTADNSTATYDTTNAAGCDSTVTLHLTIKHGTTAIDQQTACDSYSWHGTTYTADNNTATYDTLNAAGCDSTVTLHLTIGHASTGIDQQTACDSYSWHGTTYTESNNTATYDTLNAAGCDSTVTLHLTIGHASTAIDQQTACDSYSWHGTTYTESNNTATFDTLNVAGCDSTVTLHLTINHASTAIDQQRACDSYSWHGTTYTADNNTATFDTLNAAGCDSTVTLHLTIRHSSDSIEQQTACDTYTWSNNQTYTASTNEPSQSFTNAAGCDSTLTLHLTISHATTGIDQQRACDSYTWHGTSYTESNTSATFDTLNAAGCDSTVTLHLTIGHPSTGIDQQTACDSYTWHYTTYTSDNNTATFDTLNAAGCDSTVTLHLTIHRSSSTLEQQTACDSYSWHGTTYTESNNSATFDTLNAASCDSTVTLHLTINHSATSETTLTWAVSYTWYGTAYTSTGDYTHTLRTAAGCDSTVTLHLTIDNSPRHGDTAAFACDNFVWHGTRHARSGEYTHNYTADNGLDSIVTLHLTIKQNTRNSQTQQACEEYTWPANGQTYYANHNLFATRYNDTVRIANAVGCDSVITLALTIGHHSTTPDSTSVAMGSFTWYGTTYTTSGHYTHTLRSVMGCDSVIGLDLTIADVVLTGDTTATVCDNYRWHGRVLTTDGDYNHNYRSHEGYDSVVTLHLYVTHSSHGDTTATADNAFTWYGATHTSTGDYTHTLTNAAGCDSTVTLHLTIGSDTLQPATATLDSNGCDSVRFRHIVSYYDTSFAFTSHSEAGDTIYTVNLTVRHSSSSIIDTTAAAGSFFWQGMPISENGVFTDTLTNAAGCDSIRTLRLTVTTDTTGPQPATTVYDTITEDACGEVTFEDITYYADTTFNRLISNGNGDTAQTIYIVVYPIYGETIDSIAETEYIVWFGDTLRTSSTYYHSMQSSHNCDSLITLNLRFASDTLTPEPPVPPADSTSISDTLTLAACGSVTYRDTTFAASTVAHITYGDTLRTLDVTVWPAPRTEETLAVDSMALWRGDTLTLSGTYYDSLLTTEGCDSLFVLHLTVATDTTTPEPPMPPADSTSVSDTLVLAACGSVTYRDTTFAASTVAHITYGDTLRTLDVTVWPAPRTEETLAVDSMALWRGDTLTLSGTYYDSLLTTEGCDSLFVLHLTVATDTTTPEPPVPPADSVSVRDTLVLAACGSVTYRDTTFDASTVAQIIYGDTLRTLDVTVWPAPRTEETLAVDSMALWRGDTLTLSGTYYDSLLTTEGCDSLFVLHLTVATDTTTPEPPMPPADSTSVSDTLVLAACGSVTYRDTTFDTSTVAQITYGDTLRTLDVTVWPEYHIAESRTCDTAITWHGRTLQQSAIYLDSLRTTNGCDSIYAMIFSLGDSVEPTPFYPVRDSLVLDSAVVSGCAVATYRDMEFDTSTIKATFLLSGGGVHQSGIADTLRILLVSVLPEYRMEESVAVDSVLLWHGDSLTHSGTYYDSLLTAEGCDSLYVLHLTIAADSTGDTIQPQPPVPQCQTTYGVGLDTVVCHSMEWEGQMYHRTTEWAEDTLVNAEGCDSIIVKRITIARTYLREIDTTACEHFWYRDHTYTATTDSAIVLGTYADGCDSAIRVRVVIKRNSEVYDTLVACDRLMYDSIDFRQTQDYTGTPLTNSAGCDSNVHMHIVIKSSVVRDSSATVCDSIVWHGESYTTTGDHAHVMRAANGCDSSHRLHLTVHRSEELGRSATECDFYRWHDSLFTASGTYRKAMGTTAEGCPRDSVLYLVIRRSSVVRIDSSACDSLAWHANLLTRDGVTTFQTTNHEGCDSTEVLTLHLRHSTSSHSDVTACGAYLWRDSTYRTTGSYTHHVANFVGCDSLITLNLVVIDGDTTVIDTTACDRFEWRDTVFRTSTVTIYDYSSEHCVGTVKLRLRLGHNTRRDVEYIVCDSLRWFDSLFLQSTPYAQYSAVTAEGCDSTVTMRLTVNHSSHEVFYARECESYTWHGVTYTESIDSIQHRRQGTNGCDSVVTLNLTIYHTAIGDDSIRACDYYTYNGVTYTQTTVLSTTPSLSSHGCDSLTRLVLSIHRSGWTNIEHVAACEAYAWRGGVLTADTVLNEERTDNHGCTYRNITNLHVVHNSEESDTVSACDSYTWRDSTYRRSTVISHTDTLAGGCLHSEVLYLTIEPNSVRRIDTAVCKEMVLGGMVIDADTDSTVIDLGEADNGCRSLAVVRLRVIGRERDSVVSGCGSVTYKGSTYSQSVTVSDSTEMTNGCDSIVTAHLVVGQSSMTTVDTMVCGSFVWHGNVIGSTDMVIYDSLRSAAGCDSIVRLAVRKDTSARTTTTVVTNRRFYWDGEPFDHSGYYTKHYTDARGCDSLSVLHLIYTDKSDPFLVIHNKRLLMVNHYPDGVNGPRMDYYGYRWYRNGELIEGATGDSYQTDGYTLPDGCYTVEAAIDGTLEHWLPSNIICIGAYGIDDVETDAFAVYPNPTQRGQSVTIAAEGLAAIGACTVVLYDQQGRQLMSERLTQPLTTLPIEQPAGIYLLRIVSKEGEAYTTKLIVK